MKLKEITDVLEQWAPLAYQESYDNSGLIIGNKDMEVMKALITLDCTEEVIEEAIKDGCNLIIAHHPIIFSGLKRLNGNNYTERSVLKAVKHDIAIYAIHTNLDNVKNGVNAIIAERLGLVNTCILVPKKDILNKLVTYIPTSAFEKVSQAIFNAGAGEIGNYSQCGFSTEGIGSYRGNEFSNPTFGKSNELEKIVEIRFETIFPQYLTRQVLLALKAAHPYEEIAYDILTLENENKEVGSGMIGELSHEITLNELLVLIKTQFNLKSIKYTSVAKKIKKIAVCGGSGSFLRIDALGQGADAYISSDFKYHEFFDAEGQIALIDIGHYESEQYTKELIFNYLKKKIVSLQSQISRVNTNPVKYYI